MPRYKIIAYIEVVDSGVSAIFKIGRGGVRPCIVTCSIGNCLSGKKSRKTCNSSQLRPGYQNYTSYIYPSLSSPFIITEEANLILSSITLSRAEHASETHRIASRS